jgi:RNase P subunit RPR2
MIVQSAYRVAPRVDPSNHAAASLSRPTSLRRPKCPGCGSVLLVAEESRFNAKGRIDHTWSCDECGNLFVTSIRLWRR